MVLFGLALMVINGGGFWLRSLGADEVMVDSGSGRHNGVGPLAVVVMMVVMVWWSRKV